MTWYNCRKCGRSVETGHDYILGCRGPCPIKDMAKQDQKQGLKYLLWGCLLLGVIFMWGALQSRVADCPKGPHYFNSAGYCIVGSQTRHNK